jgi:hypothetical protein
MPMGRLMTKIHRQLSAVSNPPEPYEDPGRRG